MVTLVQLSKTYVSGETTVAALRDVSLEVGRGEFCAFVGPSGCGKSTLLGLVAGLDRPTSGDILLDGRRATTFTSYDWTVARRDVIRDSTRHRFAADFQSRRIMAILRVPIQGFCHQ